jgi:hypothetical protein
LKECPGSLVYSNETGQKEGAAITILTTLAPRDGEAMELSSGEEEMVDAEAKIEDG